MPVTRDTHLQYLGLVAVIARRHPGVEFVRIFDKVPRRERKASRLHEECIPAELAATLPGVTPGNDLPVGITGRHRVTGKPLATCSYQAGFNMIGFEFTEDAIKANIALGTSKGLALGVPDSGFVTREDIDAQSFVRAVDMSRPDPVHGYLPHVRALAETVFKQAAGIKPAEADGKFSMPVDIADSLGLINWGSKQ